MPERLRRITFPNGESLPVLVGSNRIPVLETTRYAICMLRNAGRAEHTIEAHMRAIAVAREWASTHRLSLETRMIGGVGLELREIEDLSRTLKTPMTKDPKPKSVRSNVVPFTRSGMESLRRAAHNPTSTLSPQTGANRIRFAAAYLAWLASQSRTADARKAPHDTVDMLRARAKISHSQPSEPRKGLLREQRERLFGIIDPSSAENPFETQALRHRNLAIITCLDDCGMRRGELAGLKIADIDFRTLTISIHRRPPDPKDPRKNKPKTKTNARDIPIRPELADILFEYISSWRRREPAARKHNYVFVAHGRTKRGFPLSPGSIGKIFDALEELLDFKLHAHLMRHTWNDRFSVTYDQQAQQGNPTAQATEERTRNYLMGWNPNSKMAERYSRRHVERAARGALASMHADLSEGLDDSE